MFLSIFLLVCIYLFPPYSPAQCLHILLDYLQWLCPFNNRGIVFWWPSPRRRHGSRLSFLWDEDMWPWRPWNYRKLSKKYSLILHSNEKQCTELRIIIAGMIYFDVRPNGCPSIFDMNQFGYKISLTNLITYATWYPSWPVYQVLCPPSITQILKLPQRLKVFSLVKPLTLFQPVRRRPVRIVAKRCRYPSETQTTPASSIRHFTNKFKW